MQEGGIQVVVSGQSLIKRDIWKSHRSQLEEIRQINAAADIAFTNYEGTLQGEYGGWPMKTGLFHASEPLVLDTLQSLGFNALSLSNNHSFDLGANGVLSTLAEVETRGFLHAGIGRDLADASQARYLSTPKGTVALVAMDTSSPNHAHAFSASEYVPARPGVNPLRLRRSLVVRPEDAEHFGRLDRSLGLIGSNTIQRRLAAEVGAAYEQRIVPHEQDQARILDVIQDASQAADLVLVYIHHHDHPDPKHQAMHPWMTSFARQCIDAGANLFVRHGFPIPQGIEIYQGRPIFYNLANFIFHTRQPEAYEATPWVWKSLIGSCTFDRRGNLARLGVHPIIIGGNDAADREAPALVGGAAAAEILEHVAQSSNALGTKLHVQGDLATIGA